MLWDLFLVSMMENEMVERKVVKLVHVMEKFPVA